MDFTKKFPAVDKNYIRIIPGLTYQGGNRLYSRHAAMTVKSVLFSLVVAGVRALCRRLFPHRRSLSSGGIGGAGGREDE